MRRRGGLRTPALTTSTILDVEGMQASVPVLRQEEMQTGQSTQEREE
jgi:hypothetical protein